MTRSTKIRICYRGASMLLYPAALPLSRPTLTYVSGIIRRHRAQIGSCWRKLNPAQQALLVLAYLRKGETFAELAAGFGVSTATAWRYVTETVGLLAARSPKLRQALPGAVHELTAARISGILRELAASGLVVLAERATTAPGTISAFPTRAGTSRNRRRRPTALTPSYAAPASAPTPSSRPGASCVNSAAAPGRPGGSLKPSTSCKAERSEDEKGSVVQFAHVVKISPLDGAAALGRSPGSRRRCGGGGDLPARLVRPGPARPA
jgi:hypothetical protein